MVFWAGSTPLGGVQRRRRLSAVLASSTHMSMKATGKNTAGKMVKPPHTIWPMSAATNTMIKDTELNAASTRAIIPSAESRPLEFDRESCGGSGRAGSDMITKVPISPHAVGEQAVSIQQEMNDLNFPSRGG